MNARKDHLRSLFSGGVGDDDTQKPQPDHFPAEGQPESAASSSNLTSASEEAPPHAARRSASGAVRAMGLSLEALSRDAQDAQRLRESLEAGERVVEIDAALIERSPFRDRLSEGAQNDQDFAALKESISAHGQQVPVLVRPYPEAEKAEQGFYQIAYGHRRLQALGELGLPVKAIVRKLDDEAFVVAQGKENAERRSLSFIERALFADMLVRHGFERTTAQAALSVHKSEMTRLLQVAELIPPDIARAIGPAPKVGRPRWMALGALIGRDENIKALTTDELNSVTFREADSDRRFKQLFDRLQAADYQQGVVPQKTGSLFIEGEGKRTIGEFTRSGRGAKLSIPDTAGKGFADYLARRLPELHVSFLKDEKEEGKGGTQED